MMAGVVLGKKVAMSSEITIFAPLWNVAFVL
jgi:hypothetical protein